METIPVVNCPNRACAAERVRSAESFSEWVHLDMTDGKFTPYTSWGSPEEWQSLETSLALEVHLMVCDPEGVLGAWLGAGAKRVVVHYESLSGNGSIEERFAAIKEACSRHGAEVMLAINPETPAEKLTPFFIIHDQFQVLAVPPGPAGQAMAPGTLEKIAAIRKGAPGARLEVDGGVTLETAKTVKGAGATTVVSGTYIFSSNNPKETFEKLRGV